LSLDTDNIVAAAFYADRSTPLRFCTVTTFSPPHHFGGDAVFIQEFLRTTGQLETPDQNND
jgi:hypothetical protein